VQLGQQQFLLGIPGLVIRDGLGGQRLPGSLRPVCGAPDLSAFPLGRGGQPASQ
jgi:hypothetical protein